MLLGSNPRVVLKLVDGRQHARRRAELLDLLRSAAIAGRRAESLEDLDRFDMLIVTEEALTGQVIDALASFLADQPSWSMPPAVILSAAEAVVVVMSVVSVASVASWVFTSWPSSVRYQRCDVNRGHSSSEDQ